MKRLLMFAAITIGGAIGWAAGERFGMMTALVLSTIGSLIAIVLVWRATR